VHTRTSLAHSAWQRIDGELDISRADLPEPKPHRERTVTVGDCSMGNIPGGSVVHICSAAVPRTLITSTQSTLFVPAGLSILGVDVQLYITHTWDSDVVATLVSPNHTPVELFSGIGADGDNFGYSCGTARQSPTLYIEDGGDAPIASPTAIPPYAEELSYSSSEPLSRFNGETARGSWTLNLVDTYPPLDDGQLLCWCLNVNGYYVNRLPLVLRAH
jgi:subtilisin-like proprotein convertase family protein